jgi:uncharacterized protein
VKAGDVVRVKVLEVDLKRNRVALTMRLSERPPQPQRDAGPRSQDRAPKPQQMKASPPPSASSAGGALAEAFARARQK